MNPSNIFGGPQTAFQSTNNTSQTGNLFQSFAQQNPTQNVGFGQPSALTQPVFGLGQPSVFNQTPAFGQTGGLGQTQTPSFSSLGSAPAFGQPGIGQSSVGFRAPPPSYSQSTGQNQSQSSGFGKPSGFGLSQTNFNPPAINQSSFSQVSGPNRTSKSSTGGRSDNTPFVFKPSNESVFKPIFSVCSEPPSSMQSSAPEPFGLQKPGSGKMENASSGSLFSCIKPSTLGFNFSQPAAAPSSTFTNASLPPKEPFAGIQFTFSQPAKASSTSTSTSQPLTPSTFSFTPKVLEPQPDAKVSVFGGAGIKSFGFGASRAENAQQTEEKVDDVQTGKSESAFGGFSMKRKEEPGSPNADASGCAEVGGDGSRQPAKRPLLRSRGPAAGLFRNALTGIMRSKVSPVKRDDPCPDEPDQPGPLSSVPPVPAKPPDSVDLKTTEDISQKAGRESQSPAQRSSRKDSTESLGGLSPPDATAIQCKGVPPNLNNKDLVKQHFQRFGTVRQVFCRPQKNLAIVHFLDHASAAKAKKNGKVFQDTEIQIFWQRKKTSQGDKPTRRGVEVKDVIEEVDSGPASLLSSPNLKPSSRSGIINTTSSFTLSSSVQRTSIAKVLQFETEPAPEAISHAPPQQRVHVLPSVLQPLIGQVAETAEEKYRLLDQRDKLLRQGLPKRTGLDMSKVFVGTCPDMCPEKERYMRETRNQLSTFEVVPDTEKVDHFAAIKEYSRSSADQEEPLPHDLRPLPVLSMTMDYLVTQIIDQGEGNCRDWYDFVWNRTRGIRKDITQQHLCDPKTVMLIEKCTRFHIHCAHHLCQEPMMSFDAKINNENMTKCLQSLKEMYQDLATKEIYCPSEAEFRQYNVLLKLNDGDILREVQQFRKEVRESREVDFAVQAFAALNSNNYVRFFKLVNAASYLSGCILHRYFNQVRSKALKILNIAMTVGSQRATILPIEDFVRILMFRNAAEAADFIQHFGLNISDGMVELSRTTYQEPDFSLPQKKSLAIEKKRSVLIGEVVNGGPLPNPPQHNPVCSFDSNNKYNGGLFSDPPSVDPNACPQRLDLKPLLEPDPKLQIKSRLLAEPQLFAEVPGIRDPVKPIGKEESGENSQTARSTLPLHLDFQPISIPQPVRPPSPPPKPEPTYTEQEIMEEADAMLHEVVTTEVSDVSQAAAQYVSVALSASDIEMETVVSEVLQELLSELYSSEIRAERERIAEEKRKLEEARKREAFLEQFSGELCAEISEDVLSQSIRETAEAEIRFALEEKEARIAQCTADVCDDLLEETLAKDVAEIAEEILKNELRLIHKFIKRWRDVVSVRRQLKRQMRGFPAASGCVDPQFKLKALVPSAPSRPSLDLLAQGMVNLGVSGNMSVSCTSLLKMRQEAVHQMKVTYYYNLLLNERLWSPLDLSTLVSANTPKAPEQIFWKATLLLPSDSDGDSSYDSGILADWLKVKLSGGCSPEESLKEAKGQIQSLCVSHSLKFIEGKTQEVYISVMASHGPLNEEDQYLLEEQNNLYGTNSLLMLLPPLVGALSPEEADVALLSALLQLRQVQQVGCWHSPIPLVVMVTGNLESKQDVEEALMLSKLVQDGFLSEYIFIHIPETLSDLQGSEQLTNVVGWLASRSPAGPPFSSHTLLQLVESGLCREFYSRLQRDKQERNLAALPSQPPEPIVQLCNSVLDFLADAVSVDGLSGLCWPPLEFSCPENALLVPHPAWNSPEHLDWLKRAILGRKLPEFDLPPSNASWPHVCASIFSYVSQIPTSPLTQPILMSRLDNLLRRVNCKYHYQGDVKDECDEPSFHDVPWDEVICLCLEHRMKDWALAPLVAEGAVLPDGEVLVYLVQDSLEGFQPPEIWEEAVKRTHQEIRASELLHSEIQILPKLHVIHSQLDFEELPVSEMQRIPMAERFEQILSSVRKIHSAEQRTSMQIQPACLSHNSPSSISNASRKRRSPSNGAKQEMETVVSAEKSQSPCKMQFAVGATHIPLVERLQQTLSAMRDMNAEGQRIGDQIQLRMDADALDSTSFPLFLTSSMLSSPPMVTTPRRKPLAAAVEQVKTDIPAQKTSLLQRLHDLKRELSSQQEDQLLSSLKLKCLVDIVEN